MIRRSVLAASLYALGFFLGVGPVCAGIFGDGDPANGVEDDRRTVSQGQGERPGDDWYRSGGTIHCDGAVRGSATILDLGSLGVRHRGVVIATAAHVLYDLEKRERWEQCRFQYLGLGALPGYAAPLRARRLLEGEFDPGADPASVTQGGGDWAFAWLGPEWRAPGAAAGMVPVSAASALGDDVNQESLGLLAWHRGAGEMSVASGCRVMVSGPGDIGGGAWAGQLLDDCDSGDGASGGGLVMIASGRPALLAIRGGAHWSREMWPPSRFPAGPPDGARWSPERYSNYARAIDDDLLDRLIRWANGLEPRGSEAQAAARHHPAEQLSTIKLGGKTTEMSE